MAYITVTTPVDVVDPGDGQLSLREAIEMANATAEPDTIRFVATLEDSDADAHRGRARDSQDLTIDGDKDNNGERRHDRAANGAAC